MPSGVLPHHAVVATAPLKGWSVARLSAAGLPLARVPLKTHGSGVSGASGTAMHAAPMGGSEEAAADGAPIPTLDTGLAVSVAVRVGVPEGLGGAAGVAGLASSPNAFATPSSAPPSSRSAAATAAE